MSNRKLNGHGKIGHNAGSWLGRAYRVVEYDPEIDRVKKQWNAEKIEKETDLAMLAGVSSSTVHNLLNGKTRRPQHATFCKVFGAMGFHYKLERSETPNYAAEVPKARGEFKLYREAMAKKKPAPKQARK